MWLAGLVWGEVATLRALFDGSFRAAGSWILFPMLLLVGFTALGLYLLYALGWWLTGREELTIAPALLSLERRIGPLHRRQAYALDSVHSFAFDPLDYTWWAPGGLTRNSDGPLVVIFGRREIRFGAGLSHSEAVRVCRLVSEAFPDLTRQGAA
jgi:hypothetical protein